MALEDVDRLHLVLLPRRQVRTVGLGPLERALNAIINQIINSFQHSRIYELLV